MIRGQRARGPVLALLLGLVVSAIGAEFILGYLYPVGGVIYRLHPEHLLEHVPGASRLFFHLPENGGGSVRVRINQQGFRGEPLASGGGPRLAVYGDSFIAGEFSPLPETFCERLEARLEDFEVVNAGIVGSGPDQILLRMRRELPELAPVVVILAVFAGNDFGDLVRNKLFGLAEDGSLRRREVRIDPELAGRFPRGALSRLALAGLARKVASALPRRIEHLLASYSATPGKTALGFHERHIEFARHEYAVRDDGVVSHVLRDGYDADVALLPMSPSARYKRALMRAILAEIGVVVRSSGARLLVMVIPAPHDLIPGYDDIEVDTRSYPDWHRRRLTDEVVNAARINGIEVVDLFEPFDAASPEALYFRAGDDHWNALGQALAAQVIANRLRELGWDCTECPES